MFNPFISPDAYELLKAFYAGSVTPEQSNENCIDQLLKYGFIESHIVDYDTYSYITPVFSDYAITEEGKGYIHLVESNKSHYDDVKRIADSAVEQADLAKEESKQAKHEARIAKIISILAIVAPILHEYVFPYVSSFIQAILQSF